MTSPQQVPYAGIANQSQHPLPVCSGDSGGDHSACSVVTKIHHSCYPRITHPRRGDHPFSLTIWLVLAVGRVLVAESLSWSRIMVRVPQ